MAADLLLSLHFDVGRSVFDVTVRDGMAAAFVDHEGEDQSDDDKAAQKQECCGGSDGVFHPSKRERHDGGKFPHQSPHAESFSGAFGRCEVADECPVCRAERPQPESEQISDQPQRPSRKDMGGTARGVDVVKMGVVSETESGEEPDE